MSEKNLKDDEASSEKASAPNENKNLILFKKYVSIAWTELQCIFVDIKNAYHKVTEEMAAGKEITAVEELTSQAKPTVIEMFKQQVEYSKKFWNYLNKKSKYFLFVIVFLIGWNLMGLSDGYSQSISSSGRGVELLCEGAKPRNSDRKIIKIDCTDKNEVVDVLGDAWQSIRRQGASGRVEDLCWEPYQRIKEMDPRHTFSKNWIQPQLNICNLALCEAGSKGCSR